MKRKLLHLLPLFALAVTALMPSVALADEWFNCRPTQIVEQPNRTGVRCSNSITLNGDTVIYFAIPKTDAGRAARFQSMAASAILSGEIFLVRTPESDATNTAGCLDHDCRTPTVFGLKKGS